MKKRLTNKRIYIIMNVQKQAGRADSLAKYQPKGNENGGQWSTWNKGNAIETTYEPRELFTNLSPIFHKTITIDSGR